MILRLVCAGALALLAACQSGTADASAGETGQATGAQTIERETDFYSFIYSYPGQAARIAGLKAVLDADAKAHEAELAAQARELWSEQKALIEADLAQAKGEQEIAAAREALAQITAFDFPFRPHYLVVGWDVAADLPRWLSLGGSVETYSGGAHGNQGFDALLWDKANGKRIAPASLFLSNAALRKAVKPQFCKLLNAERAERRGTPVDPQSDDLFDACIDPFEGVLLLESRTGKAFDTVSFLIAPYLAGSYAEGSYVIEMPVTAPVIEAVKPEYRGAFSTAG